MSNQWLGADLDEVACGPGRRGGAVALGGTSTPWLQLNSGTVVVLAEDVPSQPAQAGPRVRVVGFFSLPPLAAFYR
jgi:hypothetical protein